MAEDLQILYKSVMTLLESFGILKALIRGNASIYSFKDYIYIDNQVYVLINNVRGNLYVAAAEFCKPVAQPPW